MLNSPTVAIISIGAISTEGKAFTIELEVGTPYQRETDEWACPVALLGLYDRQTEAYGVDSFQALCMAISFAQGRLRSFRDNGGKLMMGDVDFPLEAYDVSAAIQRQS